MNALQIAALIMIVAGAVVPVMCIIKMCMIKRFLQRAIVTDAVITASEKRRGAKGSVYYVLAIRYEDDTGGNFTGNAIGAKRHVPGSTIKIMYNKNDPAEYKTDFGGYLPWALAVSLILLGLITWLCWWLLTVSYTTSNNA